MRVFAMRNEKFQPDGVAVYRDRAEIESELRNQLPKTTSGEPYQECGDEIIVGDDALSVVVGGMKEIGQAKWIIGKCESGGCTVEKI